MEDKVFVNILRKAVAGDIKAIGTMIEEYGNIINKYSCRNGFIDEDCKQQIKMQIIQDITKFKNI